MKKLNLLAVLLAATLMVPGVILAGEGSGMKHEGMGMMHGDKGMMHEGSMSKHGKMCGHGCPMFVKGAEVKVDNLKNGVTITITSNDPKIVKTIQEKAKACSEYKDKKAAAGDEMVVCPVMGKKMTKDKAFAKKEYKGKTYYFCCGSCVEAFEKNPEKYAK